MATEFINWYIEKFGPYALVALRAEHASTSYVELDLMIEKIKKDIEELDKKRGFAEAALNHLKEAMK